MGTIFLSFGLGACADVDAEEVSPVDEQAAEVVESADASKCETAVRHAHAFVEASMAGASAMERTLTAGIVAGSIEACESEGLSEAAFACITGAETYREFWSLGSCEGISNTPPSWLNASWPASSPMPDWADWTPDEMRASLEGNGGE